MVSLRELANLYHEKRNNFRAQLAGKISSSMNILIPLIITHSLPTINALIHIGIIKNLGKCLFMEFYRDIALNEYTTKT